jgi:hypothetical protein
MQRSNVWLVVWDSRNGSYGILPTADIYLLDFDVGRPDHLGPLFPILGDELSELVR